MHRLIAPTVVLLLTAAAPATAATWTPLASPPFTSGQVGPVLVGAPDGTFPATGSSPGVLVARPPFGPFGPSTQIVADIPAPDVAVNAVGDAVISWQDGATVTAASRSHDGAFGDPQLVATPAALGFVFSSSQLAIDGTGRALLAWSDRVSGCGGANKDEIHLATRTAGTWTTVQRLDGRTMQLSVAPSGTRLLVAFRRSGGVASDGCDTGGLDRVLAVTGDNGTVTSVPVEMPGRSAVTSPFSDTIEASGIDPAGNAIIVWKQAGVPELKAAALESGSPPTTGPGGPTDPGSTDPGTSGPGTGGNAPSPGNPPVSPAPDSGTTTPPPPVTSPPGTFLATLSTTIKTTAIGTPRITISCAQGPCSITVDGQVLVFGSAARAVAAAKARPNAKTYTRKRVRVTLTTGTKRAVAVPLTAAARTAARRALKRRRTVVVTLKVTSNGVAPKTVQTTYRPNERRAGPVAAHLWTRGSSAGVGA